MSVPGWFLVIYKFWEVQAMLDVKFQAFIHTLLVKAPFKNLFYWSIVGWQCCVDFCCTAGVHLICVCVCVCVLLHVLHCGLSQDVECSSLCCTVGLVHSSCIQWFPSAHSRLPVLPSPSLSQSQIYLLYLWVGFCLMDRLSVSYFLVLINSCIYLFILGCVRS